MFLDLRTRLASLSSSIIMWNGNPQLLNLGIGIRGFSSNRFFQIGLTLLDGFDCGFQVVNAMRLFTDESLSRSCNWSWCRCSCLSRFESSPGIIMIIFLPRISRSSACTGTCDRSCIHWACRMLHLLCRWGLGNLLGTQILKGVQHPIQPHRFTKLLEWPCHFSSSATGVFS